MTEVEFAGLRMLLPEGWYDITDDVEAEDVPFTLARDDGVGALQFSTAFYRGGKIPNPSVEDLREMRHQLAAGQGATEVGDVVEATTPVRVSGASYRGHDGFFRAWYLSNGLDIALVTYSCEWEHRGLEQEEYEAIVASIRFPTSA